MDSIWRQSAAMPHFTPLKGDRKTQVLIIGGGLAGLLCAHRLQEAGVDCILVEQGELCSGVTQNTTAKVTVQHGLIYHKLTRRFGLNAARLYLRANQQALEQYRRLCRDVDCDYLEQDCVVYARKSGTKLILELDALTRLGCQAQLDRQLPLPFSTAGGIRIPGQGQLHPLKLAAALAQNLPIHTHTKVLELAPGRAVTSGGTVTAEHIIVATHFPMLNKHGSFFLKQYQHRSYVIALRGAPVPDAMLVDEAADGLSFRSCGDLLLLGGGGHRTGKAGGGWQALETVARQYYPKAKIAARWAAQDCMTLDAMPYIGPYSKSTSGLYVATGFNKWGMTSAMVAADLLTDLILGRENPFARLFSPSRSILHPQLVCNAAESILGLLTPTTPRCPHLGCALKYNRAEHSWDCPCHGSRFAADGRRLDGPATGGKRTPLS